MNQTRQNTQLHIGSLMFPWIDRFDFTGPFEVFSRIPGATCDTIAKERGALRDVRGLILSPEKTFSEVGQLDNITFKEGDIVNEGDLLYVIDPRPYQVALDQAKGQLEQVLAQQRLDNANLERSKDLFAKKVNARQDFETTAAQKYVADAQVVCQSSRRLRQRWRQFGQETVLLRSCSVT